MPEVRFIRFGEFEVDLSAWVLRCNKQRLTLQRKPFQILRLLLSRPGMLITRAELAQELWPELHVSYDRCLNTAMNALRNALADPTHHSRFIETRPGLGYCFVGAISVSEAPESKPLATDANELDVSRGYYFLHRFSHEGLARARACFRAALEAPGFAASAQIGLAELEILSVVCGEAPTREGAHRALLHAKAAHSIDPTRSETGMALALASALLGLSPDAGAYDETINTCLLNLERLNTSISAQIWCAELLIRGGRLGEAVELLQRARRANPVSLLICSKLALASYLTGDYEAAVAQAWDALTIEPACAAAQYILALCYQQRGSLEDALTEFENAVYCSGGSAATRAGFCHALYEAGHATEGARIAAQLHEMEQSKYVSPCWQALVQLAEGRYPEARHSLSLASHTSDFLLGIVEHDPRFRALRS